MTRYFIQEIAGSRRPMIYEVTVESVTDGKRYTCPVMVNHDTENTTLILNCTDLLKPHQLFVVEISGSNPAGMSTVVQDLELSKYANITIHLSIIDAYKNIKHESRYTLCSGH